MSLPRSPAAYTTCQEKYKEQATESEDATHTCQGLCSEATQDSYTEENLPN